MRRWTSSLSPKGQITIPVEVRRKLGLSAKDPVVIVMDGDQIRIESPLAAVRASAGVAGRLGRPLSWEETQETIRNERAEAYLETMRRQRGEADDDSVDRCGTAAVE